MNANSATISKLNPNRNIWFSFTTQYGVAYLEIPVIAPCATDQAGIIECVTALKTHENTIRDIEDWLSCGIAVYPIDTNTHVGSDFVQIRVIDQATSTELSIYISENDALKLPPPNPHVIEKYALKTSSLTSYIHLSSLTLDDSERNQLTKGNVLLLAESFTDRWNVEVTTDMSQVEITHLGVLDNSLNSILFGAKKTNDCEIVNINAHNQAHVLVEDIRIPVSFHLGWKSETGVLHLQSKLLDCKISIIMGQHTIARGHLVKVANGYGVYLTSNS